MTVADLIAVLESCNPQAVVLIPADHAGGQGSEPVADVTAIALERFSTGPAALSGAVRLTGLATMLRSDTDSGEHHLMGETSL